MGSPPEEVANGTTTSTAEVAPNDVATQYFDLLATSDLSHAGGSCQRVPLRVSNVTHQVQQARRVGG